MTTEETFIKIRADLGLVLSHVHEQLGYLYDRWQDEREYEDFAEYEKVMRELLGSESSLEFIKATIRPFGCVVKHKLYPKHFQFVINSRQATWKIVKEK